MNEIVTDRISPIVSLLVDNKYVSLVGHSLRNFKRKKDYLWNYSCHSCGDSKKNKLKARGYIFRAEDHLVFKCHNCGVSGAFSELVKTLDAAMYKEYIYEVFLEKRADNQKPTKPKEDKAAFKQKKEYKPIKPTVLAGCPSISSLGPDHPARIYLEERKIPAKFLRELFWTDDFPSLVDKVLPNHQFALMKEGRIIIPFLDRTFKLLAIQGRTLDKKSKLRYITIKTFEDAPKIYGIHRLSKIPKRIYVVEGPFDSLFLPECVALAGSDIPKGLPLDKTLIVFDNEPRKPETCKKMEAALDHGYRICIFPETVKEKDLNLMVLKEGFTPEKLRVMIDQNSFTGLEGKLRLGRWRKDTTHDSKKNEESRKDNEATTQTTQ